MHYEVERLNLEGRWLKTGKWTKKYKLLSEAQLEAAIVKGRGSVARIVRVADDGSREVVEE
jgi:hypothetical protein